MRALPIALLLLSPSLAFAQDADPKPEPKPEPKPLMPPADPAPAVVQVAPEDDPTPVRLSAIIAEAASVQRRARIAEGVLGIVAGGGGITTGAILFGVASGPNADGTKIIGGIAIGFGGLTVLTSAWELFSRGALERLDEAYAPIAHDKSIPADKRLAEGEQALEALASSGRSSRMWSGVTSIILGVGLGIAAAPIAYAVAPEGSTTTTGADAATIRAYVGIGLGLSAFLMLASGVTTIVVKRTEAEQLWNLWLAGTGRPTSKLRFQPYVTASGIGLHF
jgi:hypothetical protein